MDLKELELEFDILLNNISSNQAPGFTPLEKSIFLTEAQEFYIKELYTTQGFEKDEEISEYLRTLVKQVIYTEEEGTKDETGNSIFFNIPEDLWFITYEAAKLDNQCNKLPLATVVPVKQDEFFRIYNNPFRGPSKNRVLRMLIDNKIELVTKYDINSYTIKYLSKPEPIVLEGLNECGIAPYNSYGEAGNPCKLPSSTHRNILLKAVQLAQAAWKTN